MIIVMGVVYFILRHLTKFEGWDLVADVILHYVMPVLFVIDWLFLVPKQTLKLNDTLRWLAYPIAYLVWTSSMAHFPASIPTPSSTAANSASRACC